MVVKKSIFVVFCMVFFVSCATTTTRRKEYFKSYSINAEQQANIGASMLTFKDITYIEGKRWVGFLYSNDGWEHFKYPSDDSFKEELIYTGRSGTTIHISYREYKKDFARPAFYQELTYDLEKSDIIMFRNYKIKVLAATNEYIQFIVLTD